MNGCAMQVFSLGSWAFAIATFLLGVMVKFLFNVLSSPKLEIEKYVVLDKRSKPLIRVKNSNKIIMACDLRFFISYYKSGKRIHTKIIQDGILKRGEDKTYSIIPQDKEGEAISFDITDSKNHVDIVLIYRNKFNTMSVKTQQVIYKCDA